MTDNPSTEKPTSSESDKKQPPGLWRCAIGATIAGSLAYACYSMTAAIAQTYAGKPIVSNNQLTVNIASAVRTLVIGIASLGTFVFAFATLGLIALFIQLAIQSFQQNSKTSSNN
jgi:Protein of unknown function (DUF3082)